MEPLDVYGICNPLIDLLSQVPDDFLQERKLEKNRMYLVPLEQQQTLLMALAAEKHPVEFAAGGSGANTMIGIAQLGGRAAFTGKIGRDEHGRIYREKLEGQGVEACMGTGEGITGSSLILVTEDASRTMNTYLGMCQELSPEDLDLDALKRSQVLYVTGYLWDTEPQKEAVRFALQEARNNSIRIALSLSDPFCVNRHQLDFQELLEQVDLVFANQEEAFLLTETSHSQDALDLLSARTETVVMTLGANGALVRTKGETFYIDPMKVRVEDTTGAGDAFAAGYLYGMTHGHTPLESGRIASSLAAAVIEQIGPRFLGNARARVHHDLGNLP